MPLSLRLRWLWLQASWTFRWAHKPLCDRFAEDVLALGSARVCRSCVCLYAGLTLALVSLFLGWAPSGAVTIAVLVATAGFSAPKVYKRWPRRARDGLRFAAGALIPWTAALAWSAPWVGVPAVVALAVAWWVYLRQRVARRAAACTGCPELGRGVCSGFATQAVSTRAFEQRASDLVARARGLPAWNESSEREGSPSCS